MASKFAQGVARGARATDDLIGRLYAAHASGIGPLVAELPDAERARLALFCYQRAHLRAIGLAVAATCDQWSLVNAAGRAGDALFASSRRSPTLGQVLPIGRRKISLATPAPRIAPIPDAPDDEDVDMDVVVREEELVEA
jgi:hypothetical protein